MTRRGCGMGCLIALALLLGLGVWVNFALAIERERAVSPDGLWLATAYIDGAPLTAENERVHIWRWWQPRLRWLGCNVLEAKNESPTRLRWVGPTTLVVEHGFRPHEILRTSAHCGTVRIITRRVFPPYS